MTQHNDETRVFEPQQRDPGAELVGTVLAGRYRIERLLGVGAMGSVYLGRHLKIGRCDAIKVLNSSMARDADAIARFDRGARNVGAIRHANVCTIYDFSETADGLQYLAMEYVAGESLKEVVDREGRLTLERAAAIMTQVAAALQAAHDAGIVHRDLKPANIMVGPAADGGDAVKVVDFDISKGSTDLAETEVTRLGYVVGTPEYMSPEQLWGGELDGRSDIYSMALVLCRLVTGMLPFDGETVQEMMSARLADRPPLRLSNLAPDLAFPDELQNLVDSALRLKAADRICTAAAFATGLNEIVNPAAAVAVPKTVVADARPLLTSNSATPQRFNPVRLAAAAALVLVLGLSGFAAKQVFFSDAGAPLLSSGDAIHSGSDSSAIISSGDEPVADPEQQDDRGQRIASSSFVDDPPAREPGAPSSGPAAATTSPPLPTVSAAEPAVLTSAVAASMIERFRDALMGDVSASRAAAVRDSAAAIYDTGSLNISQRAGAAEIASMMSVHLADRSGCTRWAQRATELDARKARLNPICQTIG